MKVYVVLYANENYEKRIVKVFSSKKKADDYVCDKPSNYWVVEETVE